MTVEPHYVSDYEAFISDLKKRFSIDEAMAHAVGGEYVFTGQVERQILEYVGLKSGMSIVDIGCGSGRLSSALSDMTVGYLGTDVVQDLLDYAASRAPPSFRFLRHTKLTIPCADETTDMACAFSVFTHLHHEESYLYAKDVLRALKPGGIFVLSFLEFADESHWAIFEQTATARAAGTLPHMITFIERSTIQMWARHIGYQLIEIINGLDAPWGGRPLGQSIAILRKPTIE